MNSDLMYSSKSMAWSTPQDFYDKLDEIYHFTLDPCSTDENHKCEKWFTEEDDGLSQSWEGETVFCNPPYGKEIIKWVEKCYNENANNNTEVVLLVPARTDTKWFHNFVYKKENVDLEFIKGRLKFGGGQTISSLSKFSSALQEAPTRGNII